MQKQCFKCLEVKPLSCFYKHKQMADGHVNKCKECNKKDVSANYRANIEHYKEYEIKRNKSPKRKIKFTEACKEFRKNNPIKYAAHNMVGNAIRDKKLIRPDNCSECGIECVPHGRHCDYAKPLDVIWFCPQCHNDWHKENTPLNGD
jgi:Rad3-related DNA helicase